MSVIDSLYAAVARQRRRWYESHPDRRRRLAQPVVSVGSLSVGGSGKTPFVQFVAALLRDAGERPAILSRGYRRRTPSDGVTVVRDADAIRVDLDHAGDEPMMLARALPGVAVVVAPERYLAGRMAERRLGATVHLLDDGFQHLQLARDIDLLVMDVRELDRPTTLPSGRLREPVTVAVRADALILSGARAKDGEAARLGNRLGVPQVFEFARRPGTPTGIADHHAPVEISAATRVLAVAGIAQPERFFDDVRALGAQFVGGLGFADHHPYTADDVLEIAENARASDVDLVLTTEKDLVRLLPRRPLPFALAALPLVVEMPQQAQFRSWLLDRLATVRRERSDG